MGESRALSLGGDVDLSLWVANEGEAGGRRDTACLRLLLKGRRSAVFLSYLGDFVFFLNLFFFNQGRNPSHAIISQTNSSRSRSFSQRGRVRSLVVLRLRLN